MVGGVDPIVDEDGFELVVIGDCGGDGDGVIEAVLVLVVAVMVRV